MSEPTDRPGTGEQLSLTRTTANSMPEPAAVHQHETLANPMVLVETADGDEHRYADALDAAEALVQGRISPDAITWYQVSETDIERLMRAEHGRHIFKRLARATEDGDPRSALSDALHDRLDASISPAGTFRFTCECGHQETCASASELRLRVALHRYPVVDYGDTSAGRDPDTHPVEYWARLGPISIDALATYASELPRSARPWHDVLP